MALSKPGRLKRTQRPQSGQNARQNVLSHLALQSHENTGVDTFDEPQCGDQAHKRKRANHRVSGEFLWCYPFRRQPARGRPDGKRGRRGNCYDEDFNAAQQIADPSDTRGRHL